MNFYSWIVRAKKGNLRQVVWLYGDQPVLITAAEEAAIRAISSSPYNVCHIDASAQWTREQIWAEARLYGGTPKYPRILLIQEAQKIKDLAPLSSWIEHRHENPYTYLVFSASSTDKSDAVILIQKFGHVVLCRLPNPRDMVRYIHTLVNITPSAARHLVARAGSDVRLIHDTCIKLMMLEGQITTEAVDALIGEEIVGDFIDSVLLLEKEVAIDLASRVSDSEQRMVVGMLNSRLTLLEKLHVMQQRELSRKEISNLLGSRYFLADKYLRVTSYYDSTRCRQRREVLAWVDDALNSGASVGVMESLVALWAS